MMNCPHCGTQVQADASFCGQCGQDLPAVSGSSPDEAPISTIPTPISGSTPAAGKEPLPAPPVSSTATQVQPPTASLFHVQTQATIELPQGLAIIHIGKPNDRIPPDIDVSGFPDSEIVSRIHAQIRVEGADFLIEDARSANGTYINHVPLLPDNRYRLRAGDRIALGREDKVSFIFQMTSTV
jgi:pSer/pThr/pTyr-binding forkhead associated (FHA) protein